MDSRLARCLNCGAPAEAGSACRYCGALRPGQAAAPPEAVQALAAIRSRMDDPDHLLHWLARSLERLGPEVARPRRRLVGGLGGLEVRLGTIEYRFRLQAGACVVERQAVAAGMPVGMLDVVPASRWPELLVLDVARAADDRGLGWQAVARILA